MFHVQDEALDNGPTELPENLGGRQDEDAMYTNQVQHKSWRMA
jgi:hypothetical protein